MENKVVVKKRCYMCKRKATSREHVPPKCFFPQREDSLSGQDHRKNLIRVPSCEFHNNKKSKDDEYLLFVITSTYQSNAEGQNLFSKKIDEIIEENHEYFLKTFFGEPENVIVYGQDTFTFRLNSKRFDTALKYMANAIYFNHFKTKWNEALEIFAPSARYSSEIPNYYSGNIQLARLEQLDAGAQRHGENQDIFFYQFIDNTSPEHRLLRMVFYQGFVIFAYPLKRRRDLMRKRVSHHS